MELVQYIRVVRRWWWLLALAALVGGAVSFVMKITEPDIYSTSTLISIGSFYQAPNPSQQDLSTSVDLAELYAQLLRTQTVLEATLDAIPAPISTGDLRGMIGTSVIPNTAFLEISLTYTDPILATDLVNELAQQVILASPTNLTPAQQSQIERLNEQISSTTQDIANLREELTIVDTQLESSDLTYIQRRDLQTQRTTLVDQINLASSNIAQFTTTVTSIENRTNSISVLEEARIPGGPQGKNTVFSAIIGAVAAGGLAFGLVILFEYINSVFHSTEDVSQILKKPVLGSISQFGKKSDDYKQKLLINNLNSRVPDEFRILRTNLLFTADLSRGLYVITSSMPNEGKTTVTSNLAISFAMSGLRVLIVDADLRKPQVHRLFDLDNQVGLSSLLTASLGRTAWNNDNHNNDNNGNNWLVTWKEAIQTKEGINNLWILTSGPPVVNPTELLGSTIMKDWIDTIQNELSFDVVLIDTAPLLGFPDGAIMSASLDAKVIAVIKAEDTRHESAKRMIERLEMIHANIIGIILNQVNPKEEDAQRYGYYLDYYGNAQ